MRRTKRLRGFIDRVAQRAPRIWRGLMTVGVAVAIMVMFFGVYGIILSLNMSSSQGPQVAPVLPGVDIPGSPIFLPLGYGIVAMMVLLVVHEFGHGIIARVENVRIKSIGLLLLAVIPGAFVEPDEEDVKKSPRISKLRIYAAGSIFNLITAALAFVIMFLISSTVLVSAFEPGGTEITSVVPQSPAEGVLESGMVIQEINGMPTNNLSNYLKALNTTKIGDQLTFKTDRGIFTLNTIQSPTNASRSYIGIRTKEKQVVKSDVAGKYGVILPGIFAVLNEQLYYIFLLNILVGIFNLLPMKPLDGGLMLEEILRIRFSENSATQVANKLSIIIAAIIVFLFVVGFGPMLF